MKIERSDEGFLCIYLDKATIEQCIHLAEKTLSRYGSKKGYYRNLQTSHLLGRAGEYAVALLLENLGESIDRLFEDSENDASADIIWREKKLDVKTWNENFWDLWGRCISVNQYPALAKKATHIIWCTSNAKVEMDEWKVVIRGWNNVSDISGFQKLWTGPEGKKVYNFQALESQLLQIQKLVPKLGE
ncbi:unannotated protein [freshwater metagenome]|uniref:Unannotated protein n=1 Tax=freshwater metagenome TaxID=449393 RepID=A0A6J6ZYA5_9ZZZZ|nr:hypothetical protein [Actinomycetota bacterium]MSX66958.1 hypothetical protein [Actinomycetota bacterium]MTA20569.1 hypothetical protein [Actinomycetota bacterium]